MNKPSRTFLSRFLLALLGLAATASHAEDLNIAVASNFAQTMHSLAEAFENKTGHKTRISSASTGKLYAQINNGAPFDVFLSADEARPELLITEGKAEQNMSRTYALGKLVLLSNIKGKGGCRNVLGSDDLKRLAIANPKTAPYGVAAQSLLQNLGHWEALQPKLVMGENIAQTLQFVTTGSATAGLVARSMLDNSSIRAACKWDVPSRLYQPIKQKMVVLSQASNKASSKAFWEFMQSEEANAIIRDSGYDVL